MSTKVALITGCSEPNSVGAATALELQRRGYRVFATARSVSSMTQLAAAGCELLALDVTSSESIHAAAHEVSSRAGRLDVLINNAGVSGNIPILDAELDKIKALFEVNVFGPIALTQALSPLLVSTANSTGNKNTVILNVGSTASIGIPFLSTYAASKASSQAFSDALRAEMHNLGVRVITLELSTVRTAMTKGEKRFDLTSSTPSGYYPNYESDIWGPFDSELTAQLPKAPSSSQVAGQIADVITTNNPPGKIWLGRMSGLFRYVVPLLPVSVVDTLRYKGAKANNVLKPVPK